MDEKLQSLCISMFVSGMANGIVGYMVDQGIPEGAAMDAARRYMADLTEEDEFLSYAQRSVETVATEHVARRLRQEQQ